MLNALVEHLRPRLPDILADVETLVRIDSPSRDLGGVNAVIDRVAAWLAPLGSTERHRTDVGDVLHFTRPGRGAGRVVMLAHADTVYPRGAWRQPWRVEGDLVFGPGVNDMKGGIVQAVWALRALDALGLDAPCSLELLLTPDEEIESRGGRPFIEARADGARGVLVVEPPTSAGHLKVARKGVGTYRLTVTGKAAHQGTEPEKGVNAVVAAADLVTRIVALQDLALGTTLGPNVIRGGTVSNVVADRVDLEVDVRVWSAAEADRVDAAMRALRPALPGATLEVRDGLNRPPMEPTEGAWALFESARAMCETLGLGTEPARVGGGSDGNFTARLAPTLDGFGARGEAAHQRDLESLFVPDLVPRTALLAAMLLGAE